MDIGKFISNASSAVTRVVQYTEEKLFNVEKTAYNSRTEFLMQQTDLCQALTERIVKAIENFIEPNPAYRLESMVYEKLDGKRVNRDPPANFVGETMIAVSNEIRANPSNIEPQSNYSKALQLCGESHHRVGLAQQELMNSTRTKFIEPLQNYLEQVKNVQKERKELENKRLDLDSVKTKLKRVVVEEAKRTPLPEKILSDTERELKCMQMEFDQQLEVTNLLMENVVASLDYHTRLLCDLVDCEAEYYERCHEEITSLQQYLKEF